MEFQDLANYKIYHTYQFRFENRTPKKYTFAWLNGFIRKEEAVEDNPLQFVRIKFLLLQSLRGKNISYIYNIWNELGNHQTIPTANMQIK